MPVQESLEAQKGRILASGGQVGGGLQFDKVEIRVNDGSNMFEEGDEFTIPVNYGVDKFIRVFNSNKAPGLVVAVGDLAKELYMSAFTKSVVMYNEDGTRMLDADGKPLPAAIASGTACDEWRKYPNVEAALKAFAGKKIKITKIDSIPTMRLQNNGSRTFGSQWLFTMDLVA